jgi:hypothetical protein
MTEVSRRTQVSEKVTIEGSDTMLCTHANSRGYLKMDVDFLGRCYCVSRLRAGKAMVNLMRLITLRMCS